MERPIRFVRIVMFALVDDWPSRFCGNRYARLSMVLYVVVRTMDGWFPFAVQTANEMDWFVDYVYSNGLSSVSCIASDGTFLVFASSIHAS